MKNNKLPKLIVILGPTATGKTGLAIKLAKKFKGEIVSADSRQIYKEMTVGTAKPTKKEMKAIPHHLIDIIYPNEKFNVALYKKMAIQTIKDIQKKKKIPFLVGGTGLYIQSIIDNVIFPEVSPQKEIRKELMEKTKEELFKIYKKLDPRGAEFIDKENKRRLIRAIEVCKVTKKPFWGQRKKGKPLFNILQIGIRLSKEELKKRISTRTKNMFKSGLEKEVEDLRKKYGKLFLLQTIGYLEWPSFPLTTKENKEVKNTIKYHTLQFSKRQMTWFKRDKRIHWIKNYSEAEKIVKEFLKN